MIWEFHVDPRKRGPFERAYGSRGTWAKFFQGSEGYIRTELIRDVNSPNRYFTLDYWRSGRHYEMFRKMHRDSYLEIDRKCETLTTKETEIGRFRINP